MHVHTMESEAISREPSTSGQSAGLNFFFSTQPQTARLSPSYGSLIYGCHPDSGKWIELALAVVSCPWGPDNQTLIFLYGGCSGAGYLHKSHILSFRGPESGCLKIYGAKWRAFRSDKLWTIRRIRAFLNTEGTGYLGLLLLLSEIKGKFGPCLLPWSPQY
jgi:hypothetical protein